MAVLGTGPMGAPMARNLAGAGMRVRAWNRTAARAAPLRAERIEVCDTAAEAVAGAGVVLTVLHDADATAAVMGGGPEPGGSGALAATEPGTVWVQAATVGVEGCARLASLARDAGVLFVDAPVLGTRKPAADGTLTVLASGPEAARARCQPVLDAIGSSVRWVGPAGTGSRLKLVVNNWLLTVTEAVAESVALAEALGVEPHDFLGTIAGSQVDCAYAHLKGGAMLAGRFDPSFTVAAAVKDARLVTAAAEAAGLDLPVTDAVLADFTRALESGHGDQDMAATYLVHRPGAA